MHRFNYSLALPKVPRGTNFESNNRDRFLTLQVDVEFVNENQTGPKRKETTLSVNCTPNLHRSNEEQVS